MLYYGINAYVKKLMNKGGGSFECNKFKTQVGKIMIFVLLISTITIERSSFRIILPSQDQLKLWTGKKTHVLPV